MFLLLPSIERLVEGHHELLRAEKCKLIIIPPPRDVKVRVYEPQIHDITDRLINNAVKFCTSERLIEVNLNIRDREIAVEVCDRGIGLDPAKLQEALDAFGQIDRDRLEQQGSGLGLAIASRYATINGGRLEFEKREGGGTIATLILPIYEKAAG